MGLSFKPTYLIPGLGQIQAGYDAANSALDIDGSQAGDRLDKYQGQSAAERARAKAEQYKLLGEMKAPTISPAQEARLKALETESTTPLVQDKGFQSNVRQVTSGGAAALSGIQNKQVASGATGGFANQGSISDVYDRVGGQLSQIAQQQNASNEAKRDTVANARQAFSDAQVSYQNAITQAKIAIEAGDAQAAQAAMAQAYQAREAMANRQQQLILGVAGMGVSALAGHPSAPAAAPPQAAPAANYAGSDPFASTLASNGGGYAPHYQTRYLG